MRFITVTYDGGALNAREFALPAAINSSLNSLYLTSAWAGSSFWNFALGNGSNNGNWLNHYGIWWEDSRTNPASGAVRASGVARRSTSRLAVLGYVLAARGSSWQEKV